MLSSEEFTEAKLNLIRAKFEIVEHSESEYLTMTEQFEKLIEVAYDKFDELTAEELTEEATELFSDIDPLTLEWS